MFSLANRFYSVNQGGSTQDNVFVHNSNNVPRARFYGDQGKSNITFVANPAVDRSKVFKTINYEGSNGWQVMSFVSDITGVDSFELDGGGQPIGYYHLN